MSYQILPNIIFIFAILGILILILRRLPEAASLDRQTPKEQPLEQKLLTKGLPAVAISKIKSFLGFWGKKIWNFALEAKDLKHTAFASYKIKQLFNSRLYQPSGKALAPAPGSEVKNEQDFLDIIKNDPKNLANYDALGKFYLDEENLQDACDIYQYLTRHEAGNADYHARLAFCYYRLKDYGKTAEHYEKSVALDSSQPHRYYNLGLALGALEKNQAAVESINKALILEPGNPKFYIGLSSAYEKLGEKALAKTALQKAKQLDPFNETAAKKLEKLKLPE